MNVTETALAWLGPVSSARPGGGEAFLYLICALFVSAIVWQVFRERARTTQVRQFAANRKLTYIGSTVPGTLPLHRTQAFQWARSIRRAVVGSNGSKDIVLFDCTVGRGRGERHRTVVAVRGQRGGLGWAQFGPDLVTEEVGEWTFVYGSNRYLLIEEIDALVMQFRAPEPSAN